MPIDYALMKREVPKLKAALTRARTSNDPKKLLAAANKGLTFFADNSYIDDWRIWENARRDAVMAMAFGRKTLREE